MPSRITFLWLATVANSNPTNTPERPERSPAEGDGKPLPRGARLNPGSRAQVTKSGEPGIENVGCPGWILARNLARDAGFPA
jgi:hypothetical protein